MHVYLNEKGPSAKIQWLNVFKDHHIVAYKGPIVIGNDKWEMFLPFWKRFYHGHHGKYMPELSEYLKIYWCQLNFAMFVQQACFVFLGNILTIQIGLYAVFINFKCIFMYE